MYLYIFEDGQAAKSSLFLEEDRQNCDDGLIDVIDLHAENPRQYYEGEWHDIKKLDRSK